jgi:hypothetical protein
MAGVLSAVYGAFIRASPVKDRPIRAVPRLKRFGDREHHVALKALLKYCPLCVNRARLQ